MNKTVQTGKYRTIIFLAMWLILLSSCLSYGSGDYYYYDLQEASEELGYALLDSYYERTYEEYREDAERKRLAVISIVDEEGHKSETGKRISDIVRNILFEEQLFSILERDRIESMLEEVNFTRTGMVDETSAAELGGLLGAELVMIGSHSPFTDEYSEENGIQIDARIVDLQTGEILGTGRVTYIIEELEE